jgi:hypothetical protein
MNSTFVTDSRLTSLYDLPISCPEVQLQPGDWLALATVQLPAGAALDLLWLQLNITSSPSTTVPVLNSQYAAGALISLFLIQNWVPAQSPTTQSNVAFMACPANPANAATAALPIVAAWPSGQPLSITSPGNYTLVALNNTTNNAYNVVVSGAVTIDMQPES